MISCHEKQELKMISHTSLSKHCRILKHTTYLMYRIRLVDNFFNLIIFPTLLFTYTKD